MQKRSKSELETWQVELYEAAEINVCYYQKTLEYIAGGGRIVEDDIGDITADEQRKASYWVATYQAWLAQREYNHANDNKVATDEELADLISGDW